ncbi:MAG: ABC transporter ATP-binding protein [Betaproteobacteria bacterium]|nr:MAG: ABC transporter ATP-binding protein [Betaproteobacteria bacterium]
MSPASSATSAVTIENLRVTFAGGAAPVRAVNNVSLRVTRGETVALIGESGSGKSVTLRSLLRLHPAKKTQMSGQIEVGGRDVMAMNASELAAFRGRVASMIFQEPLLALDPVYSVGDQIIESIQRHMKVSRSEAHARALKLFEQVRIPSPERRLAAYPHEMSGGMRQRVMIALALACEPELLLADEPTTALDATVQIQILLLLRELQSRLGLSIIFVTHDIGAAVEVADRIAVMYAGEIVEEADVRTLMRAPRHPYTQALLQSRAHGSLAKGTRLATIGGAPPDLANLPPGCAFAPRCVHVEPACREGSIAIAALGPTHQARCRRTHEIVWQHTAAAKA